MWSMGFNPETQRFSRSNFSMHACQVPELIHEMKAPSVRFVNPELIWVDRTPEKDMWIDGRGETRTDTEVLILGEKDPELYARIFKIRSGIIADFSHWNIKRWDIFSRFSRTEMLDEECDVFNKTNLPIIHAVFNPEELELIAPVLKRTHKIDVEQFDLSKIFEAIGRANAIDDENDEPGEDGWGDDGNDDDNDDDNGGSHDDDNQPTPPSGLDLEAESCFIYDAWGPGGDTPY
jgi:hypothetical protein